MTDLKSGGGAKLVKPMLVGTKRAATSDHKKAAPPKMGEAFGPAWQGIDRSYATMPGGGVLQFNLDNLQLSDFRMMKDHYQVNASLSILTFMLHQMDWRIECDNKKIRDHCQANMEQVWTRLVRALSQSFWAGYSPSILQWENDMNGKTIQLTKIKDLIPEECEVNWKNVEGWAPPGKPRPKIKVYDGIKQFGGPWPIPVENTLWYPLLMENGNWYGRRLLRPAFSSWFFSIIIHLFSNRYFERFGEPLPIGRAPYDDTMSVNGEQKSGTSVMLGLMQNLRNRGVVVLPSERSTVGTETKYDYSIEYLESQMRGADFERYLTRLDEEISLSLFTPLLMLRTADVGSYNLGTTHAQVYMQMLNAIAGDWAQYINDYILTRMVDINFSPTSPRARIKFRKLGNEKLDLVKTMLQQLLAKGTVGVDMAEMGDIAGLTLTEVEEVTREVDPPANDPASGDPADEDSGGGGSAGSSSESSRRAAAAIFDRVSQQVGKAWREGTYGGTFSASLGYRRQLVDALQREGVPRDRADGIYRRMEGYVEDVISAGSDAFSSAEDVCSVIKRGLDLAVEQA